MCAQLAISDVGKKGLLVSRIVHFIETGEIIMQSKFPKQSCAQRGREYPLIPNGLVLHGAYKNDLKTRQFFKTIIGEYFHFTAFGIDWLNERWQQGKPPTYQQFADMWVTEYALRKKFGSTPKEEWAYITFVQNYIKEYPDAPRDMLMNAWKKERMKNVALVEKLLQPLLK